MQNNYVLFKTITLNCSSNSNGLQLSTKFSLPTCWKLFTEYLVYQTQINRLDITQTKSYYGTCQKILKECHLNHPASFGNKSTEKTAEFSKYIWELKNSSICYDSKWATTCKTKSYTSGFRKCDLCLTEKMPIMKANPNSLLNTRDEFVFKSKHIRKLTLRFSKKK